MRPYFALKHSLKRVRWQIRRGITASRWGIEPLKAAPIVFGNAMPKSGSHLINQILTGLNRIGPFVKTGFPPINRFEDNTNLPPEKILANLERLQPGDVGYGYLRAHEPFLSLLTHPPFATIFVYRDPRDMIVSHVIYATEMHPGHGMHAYYQSLDNYADRINAAIRGVQAAGNELPAINTKYEPFLAWLHQKEILCLRFEDLRLKIEPALNQLLDLLETHNFIPMMSRSLAVQSLRASIAPQRSGTFRKGQPGSWREYFSEDNKRVFKRQAGDLLILLGYEKGNDW